MKRLALLLLTLVFIAGVQAADRAFLGVVPDKSVEVRAGDFSGRGLLLKQVIKGPASSAGMRSGDILTHLNGKVVEDGDDLAFFLRKVRPGQTANVDWVRGDERMKANVKLAARPESDVQIYTKTPALPSLGTNRAFLGIGTLSVNENLLTHFGVTDGHGILIDSVVKGSPAEKSGLRVGDVLVEMDGRAVDSPGRLRRLMADYDPGAKVRLKLVRNRQPLTVDIVVQDRDTSELELEREPGWPATPELPGLPDLPQMPAMPELPQIRDVEFFPGLGVLDSTLSMMKRLLGSPIALLEK